MRIEPLLYISILFLLAILGFLGTYYQQVAYICWYGYCMVQGIGM
jgi:hypothetical protein